MITEFIPMKYRRAMRFAQLNCEANRSFPHILHDGLRPLVLGPSQDPVFRYMSEHFGARAHFLSWENFGKLWDFKFRNGYLSLNCNGQTHSVSGFYIRAFEGEESNPNFKEVYQFLQLLCASPQRRIGTLDLGISNTSKILHLHSAVRKAALGLQSIAAPETLLVKSKSMSGRQMAELMGPSVAKSLSSTRTQVFDDRKFRRFTRHRPARAPVLIQKKKTGIEVRVHCVGGKLFPIGIRNLEPGVDYRYSKDIEMLHDIQLTPDEISFCHHIQRLEGNPLIGVDFIRDGKMTYCFEANPNPGWASFEYQPEVAADLGSAILNYLEG